MITDREKELVLRYIVSGKDTIPKMATAYFGDNRGNSWKREKDNAYFRRIIDQLVKEGKVIHKGKSNDKRVVRWEVLW